MSSLDFGGLRIEYDDRVLQPRPWTVAQSEWAAELIAEAPPGPVLELCTGAGHIGLLAIHLAPRSLVAVDLDPVACDFARRNAAAAGLEVDVRQGHMDDAVAPDERFSVVIADPPWVPTDETQRFPEDPLPAIDGGADGLDLVRSCLAVISRHLVPGGAAVLQVGPDGRHVAAVEALVSAYDDLNLAAVRTFPRGTLLRIDHDAIR